MDRKVLALVISALLAAGATHTTEVCNKDGNGLDLYGKIDGLRYSSGGANDDGDQTYFRDGFGGETQINDMLTGYGQWEHQINTNTTESNRSNNFTRLVFAGLKLGDYGSFNYGRNYGIIYDVEGWTDMLPEFGGDSYTKADSFMTGRASGMITYRNTDFFDMVNGLNFALQYQGADEQKSDEYGQESTGNGGSAPDNSRNAQDSNGDGFGLSSTCNLGMGVSLGAIYTTSDRTNEQTTKGGDIAGGDKADSWTVGMRCDASNVYLATMYIEAHNITPYGNSGVANKTQSFEVAAQYQFDFGLRPSASFLMSKGQDLDASGSDGDENLAKCADIGATYYFSKSMSIYVDYKINLLDEDDSFYTSKDISTDDVAVVGLVYQF